MSDSQSQIITFLRLSVQETKKATGRDIWGKGTVVSVPGNKTSVSRLSAIRCSDLRSNSKLMKIHIHWHQQVFIVRTRRLGAGLTFLVNMPIQLAVSARARP